MLLLFQEPLKEERTGVCVFQQETRCSSVQEKKTRFCLFVSRRVCFKNKKKRKEERTGVVQPGEEPGVLLFKKEEQVFVSFNN